MGHRVLVSLPLDEAEAIQASQTFLHRLFKAIFLRTNPNVPTLISGLHGVQLGQQFRSEDKLHLFCIEEGSIIQLSIEEQIYLQESLRKFRRSKLSQKVK